MVLKKFGLETVIVRCLGDQLDFWLGSQQKNVSWSIIRVWGQVMCGLGVLVGLMDERFLRDVKTNVAGRFLPRRPH